MRNIPATVKTISFAFIGLAVYHFIPLANILINMNFNIFSDKKLLFHLIPALLTIILFSVTATGMLLNKKWGWWLSLGSLVYVILYNINGIIYISLKLKTFIYNPLLFYIYLPIYFILLLYLLKKKIREHFQIPETIKNIYTTMGLIFLVWSVATVVHYGYKEIWILKILFYTGY